MEELTVSTGDAIEEITVDVSSGDVEILEDTAGDVLQEDHTGAAEPAEPVTLVDVSEVVAAVQSLESTVENSAVVICLILGFIAGTVVVKGLWTGKD